MPKGCYLSNVSIYTNMQPKKWNSTFFIQTKFRELHIKSYPIYVLTINITKQ